MARATLPKALRVEVERLGKADIMVGIPSFKNAATIGYVVRAAQAGLVQYFPDLRPVLVNADAGSPDGTAARRGRDRAARLRRADPARPAHATGSQRVSLTYPRGRRRRRQGRGAADDLRDRRTRSSVEALVVVDSDLRSIVPEWIELLAGPILKGGYDFVAPLYARYKYDGTITNTVTYPLTRALYGLRIRQPIGGDFGVSGDLVRHYLAQDDWTPDVSRFGIDIWMTTTAHHRRLRGLPDAPGRQGPRPQGPGRGPGADVPPGRGHDPAARRPAHAERWLRVQGSARRARPTASSGSSTRRRSRSTRIRLLDEFRRGPSRPWATTWQTGARPAETPGRCVEAAARRRDAPAELGRAADDGRPPASCRRGRVRLPGRAVGARHLRPGARARDRGALPLDAPRGGPRADLLRRASAAS